MHFWCGKGVRRTCSDCDHAPRNLAFALSCRVGDHISITPPKSLVPYPLCRLLAQRQMYRGEYALAKNTAALLQVRAVLSACGTLRAHPISSRSPYSAPHLSAVTSPPPLGHPLTPRPPIRLSVQEYEDLLDTVDLYSLMALASFYAGDYDMCSQAFIKLESSEALSAEQREKYGDLAVDIFLNRPPGRAGAGQGGGRGRAAGAGASSATACVATGQQIGAGDEVGRCGQCRHTMLAEAAKRLRACPLCHGSLLGPSPAQQQQQRRREEQEQQAAQQAAAALQQQQEQPPPPPLPTKPSRIPGAPVANKLTMGM